MKLNGTNLAFGWTIGYFVLVSPIGTTLSFPFIHSLVHSIIGIGVAILILTIGDKND